jgi:hypothetical protein
VRARRRWGGIVCVAAAVVGCTHEPSAPPPLAPSINASSAVANTDNVLSAVVTIHARNADSIAVRFHSGAVVVDDVTAAVQMHGDSAIVPVLGLLPLHSYTLRAVAFGAGKSVVGEPMELTTGALPDDLPAYSAGGVDPSPGYVIFAAKLYGVVIDNTGRVVWYHRFPNGPGLSFMAEPNGHYAARPSTPDPTDTEPWVEIDPLGNVTRTLGCAFGLQSRPHDLIAATDGSYWLMCDEIRTMDLTAVGGVAEARVTGTDVQHIAADGTVLFEWSPFDHFSITDGSPADRAGPNVNWTHGNALDIDFDGNLIVSFRNLGEVDKIDIASGNVIWRMGGKRSDLTFTDPPLPMFAGQHSVRISGPAQLMILDNVGLPNESRAERYVVDETARTVRLVQSYSSSPPVVTQIGGSVQSLPHGRTLVSFGTAGRVEEYDAAGQVLWSIQGNAGYVFRAERIRSLYAPGVGSAR